MSNVLITLLPDYETREDVNLRMSPLRGSVAMLLLKTVFLYQRMSVQVHVQAYLAHVDHAQLVSLLYTATICFKSDKKNAMVTERK